jgi:hypothetical protein
MNIGDTYLGKEIAEKHEFNVQGTFESFYEASRWAKQNGYELGSMDGRNPIAMMKGYDYIAKWHNLSNNERKSVHGVMISDYFREQPVTILIFKQK